MRVEAMNPVPQRLPVHAADLCSLPPAHPVQRRRDRKQGRLWFESFVEAAKRRSCDGVWLGLISTVLGMAQVLHATLNPADVNLGILRESHRQAVGIIPETNS